jgi:hypothetical protein
MPEHNIIKPQSTGSTVTVRQDFAEELSVGSDLSAVAAAAAAKAEIEARIVAARKWRRDDDLFREGILKSCRRPMFADIALYQKPVGRKKNADGKWEDAFVVDFSIRFIESALQHYGNVHIVSRIGYEDTDRALLTVQVIDVERNVGYSTDAMLEKVVERKEVKAGRKALGMRENSYGDTVYLVEATRDEFRNVMGTERSKLIRDSGKRLLPRDILDEARLVIDRTLADENARDPDAAKKKVLDRFAGLGISATMLKEYLERPIETLTVKDLNELGVLHNGLKEGDFSWSDVTRTKHEPAEGGGETSPQGGPKRSKLRDKVMALKPEGTPAPEAATAQQSFPQAAPAQDPELPPITTQEK